MKHINHFKRIKGQTSACMHCNVLPFKHHRIIAHHPACKKGRGLESTTDLRKRVAYSHANKLSRDYFMYMPRTIRDDDFHKVVGYKSVPSLNTGAGIKAKAKDVKISNDNSSPTQSNTSQQQPPPPQTQPQQSTQKETPPQTQTAAPKAPDPSITVQDKQGAPPHVSAEKPMSHDVPDQPPHKSTSHVIEDPENDPRFASLFKESNKRWMNQENFQFGSSRPEEDSEDWSREEKNNNGLISLFKYRNSTQNAREYNNALGDLYSQTHLMYYNDSKGNRVYMDNKNKNNPIWNNQRLQYHTLLNAGDDIHTNAARNSKGFFNLDTSHNSSYGDAIITGLSMGLNAL